MKILVERVDGFPGGQFLVTAAINAGDDRYLEIMLPCQGIAMRIGDGEEADNYFMTMDKARQLRDALSNALVDA